METSIFEKNKQTKKDVKDVTKGGNVLKKTKKENRGVQRTKSWIFEAFMTLMDKKSYNKITVSDIAEKAGVARPTFYRYYDDKDEIIIEYLLNTLKPELLNTENDNRDGKQNAIVLTIDQTLIKNHQKNLKKILTTTDIEYRIFREVQKLPLSFIKQYKEKLSPEEYLFCRYKICYQITGSLRALFDWFINNMPMPIETIVLMLNAMNIPKSVQYRNIPSILVRLKNK